MWLSYRINVSSLSSVSSRRAEAKAFAPSSPRCPGGVWTAQALLPAAASLSCRSLKRQKEREGNCGLPEGTTMAISAGGFSHKISRKPPRESKTWKHITGSRVRSGAGAGWDELGLGLHAGLDSDAVYRSKYPRLSLNPKRLMAGVGLRAQSPSGQAGGGPANKLQNKKRGRGAKAEAPDQYG